MIMKAIDGTGGGESAPRPTRASRNRAIYDAVEALGKTATIREIRDFLPATDDGARFVAKGAVERTLYNAVYAGYLVHNSRDDTYRIAPLSYWKARQAIVREKREESQLRAQPYPGGRTPETNYQPTIVYRPDWKLITAVAWAAFFLGVITGTFL